MLWRCGNFSRGSQKIFRKNAKLHSHSLKNQPLRKNCPYLELCWSIFSRIRTEYSTCRLNIPHWTFHYKQFKKVDHATFLVLFYLWSTENVFVLSKLYIKHCQQLKDVTVVLKRDFRIPVLAKLALVQYAYTKSMRQQSVNISILWYGNIFKYTFHDRLVEPNKWRGL